LTDFANRRSLRHPESRPCTANHPPTHWRSFWPAKRISQPQYLAGREYQRRFAIAGETGALERCHRELVEEGAALVRAVLLAAMTPTQIAAARGLVGPQWQSYFARRLGGCLDTIAMVFGFAGEAPRQELKPSPPPPP
jgi:hypothetical protein